MAPPSGAPLLLLLLVLSFATTAVSLTAAAGFPPLLPPPGSSSPVALTPILSKLGFQELAMAATSLSSPFLSLWSGPITIFAPSDDSVRSCLSCSPARLLREHLVPGLFSHLQLSKMAFGTKLETSSPGRCLTVTSTASASGGGTSAAADVSSPTEIFVDGVQITQPDLFNDGRIVVHGIQGFVAPLSPMSCNQLPDLSNFASASSAAERPGLSAILRLMLLDAMARLREGGYSILALAMRIKYPELSGLHNMTVFALDDDAIFAGGHAYITSVRFHVVPDRLLTHAELTKMPAGTTMRTLVHGQNLVVTSNAAVTPAAARDGPIGSGLRINYVPIKRPEVVYNSKIVVHGIYLPFPHLSPWDMPVLGGLMAAATAGTSSMFEPPAPIRQGAGVCDFAAVCPGKCTSGADPLDLDDGGL